MVRVHGSQSFAPHAGVAEQGGLASAQQFQSFHGLAQLELSSSTGIERVRRAVEFVDTRIPYNPKYNRKGGSVIPALESGEGACLDRSAILAEILKAEGFDAEMVTGRLRGSEIDHVWARVVIDGVEHLADPLNQRLGPYAQVAFERGYMEFGSKEYNEARYPVTGTFGGSGSYGGVPNAPESPSTVRVVNVQSRPAAGDIVKGIIYTPIGADLLISNTKSLVVQAVEGIGNYLAPHYFSEAKSAIGQVPYISEIVEVVGAILLIDGAIRLVRGGYRAHANQRMLRPVQ